MGLGGSSSESRTNLIQSFLLGVSNFKYEPLLKIFVSLHFQYLLLFHFAIVKRF